MNKLLDNILITHSFLLSEFNSIDEGADNAIDITDYEIQYLKEIITRNYCMDRIIPFTPYFDEFNILFQKPYLQ